MLLLDKREFVYEFNYEIKQPTLNATLCDFSILDCIDINKRKEWLFEAIRYATTKLKSFILQNNFWFLGVLTVILTITVIANLLLLCYYFKCYSTIYFKILSFYVRTQKLRRIIKRSDIVIYINLT